VSGLFIGRRGSLASASFKSGKSYHQISIGEMDYGMNESHNPMREELERGEKEGIGNR
jgi:hypothetical protein